MFEIKKEKEKIYVEVKLKKRLVSKEPIVFIYTQDVLKEVKEQFPDLQITSLNSDIATNTREPYGGTWIFNIEKKTDFTKNSKKDKNQKQSKFFEQKNKLLQKVEEQTLTNTEESAKMEETVEDREDLCVQETTE